MEASTATPPSSVLLNPATPATIGSELEDAAPWKGRHLDFQEAEAMVQRSPARLISVLGPYDAGKTSLMASFFLQIANGQYGNFAYRFASSRTLYGFQDLVDRANRWSGNQGEQVVDHTPKEESRDPGRFLHLGLRPSDATDDRHLDVLLTDVAGEWIEEWTRRVDDGARRRLAFIPRSDGFLVVVDTSALLGTSGAKMDAAVGRLIRRIVASAGNHRGRGLALVFSKFDRIIDQIEPPEETACQERGAWGRLGKLTPAIWSALEHGREAGFLTAPFAVSAFPKPLKRGQPAGVIAPFSYIMMLADRRERWPRLATPIREGGSQFEAMRRWDAET
ncbi:TRAFAC clade GTPase domain-containing protein [Sorangium sp. So ce388]|uniref:TRAFAC clade GTPase domain-containing protein n=1 Tax=Sorangium sp. So ce388 TaxID=3133309 RepID=UPI003F5B2537